MYSLGEHHAVGDTVVHIAVVMLNGAVVVVIAVVILAIVLNAVDAVRGDKFVIKWYIANLVAGVGVGYVVL